MKSKREDMKSANQYGAGGGSHQRNNNIQLGQGVEFKQNRKRDLSHNRVLNQNTSDKGYLEMPSGMHKTVLNNEQPSNHLQVPGQQNYNNYHNSNNSQQIQQPDGGGLFSFFKGIFMADDDQSQNSHVKVNKFGQRGIGSA